MLTTHASSIVASLITSFVGTMVAAVFPLVPLPEDGGIAFAIAFPALNTNNQSVEDLTITSVSELVGVPATFATDDEHWELEIKGRLNLLNLLSRAVKPFPFRFNIRIPSEYHERQGYKVKHCGDGKHRFFAIWKP
jgi:hypothetical protein